MLTEIQGTLLKTKVSLLTAEQRIAGSRATWSLTIKERRELAGRTEEVAESRG